MDLKEFLDSKKIKQPDLIVSEDLKTHTLSSLLNEYAWIYSKQYLCFSKIIEIIDDSADLKELEININKFFNRHEYTNGKS